MKKSKPVKAYCAKEPEKGELDIGTLGEYREGCWRSLVASYKISLSEFNRIKRNYQKDGWKVVRVTVTED